MTKAERRTFRVLQREGEAQLADLWASFWLGAFEPRGKPKLWYETVAGHPPDPATREWLTQLGAPSAAEVKYTQQRKDLWKALANVPYGDVSPVWRHGVFEKLLITDAVLKEWLQTRSDDRITVRVQRVLTAAAKVARKNPKLSHRAITERLVGRGGKLAGYSRESIRKILNGTFQPGRVRNLPGLKRWMDETG